MEKERELMEVRSKLEGENSDLQRDIDEKNKVQYTCMYTCTAQLCVCIIYVYRS